MSKKKRYGAAGIGIATALIPLVTVVVRYFLERRAYRNREDGAQPYDERREPVRQNSQL